MDELSWALVVWALASGAAFLLVGSGTRHVLKRRQLLGVLAAQRLPVRTRRLVATLLGPAEVAVGAAVLAAVASGSDGRLVVGAGGVLYVAFAAYLVRLQRVAPGAPCGCLSDDEAASPATTARAALLGAACLLAAALGTPDWALTERLVVLAVGVVVALMAATLTSLAALRS